MPAATMNNRTGRSVLDYQTEEEVIKALGSVTLGGGRSNCNNHKEPSDWMLCLAEGDPHASKYEPQSTLKEAQRLAVLRDYALLETDAEAVLDDVTRETAQRLQVDWALISLMDMGRQWFKSVYNKNDNLTMGVAETARQQSFCTHAIQQKRNNENDEDDVFVVPNALQDSRFASSPLVADQHPGLRFYAGVPLTVPEGVRLGALCVCDQTPRPGGLSAQERADLKGFANQVVEALVARKQALDQQAEQQEQEESTSHEDHQDTSLEGSSTLPRTSSKHAISKTATEDSGDFTLDAKKSRTQSPHTAKKIAADSPALIAKPQAAVSLPDPKTDGVDPDTYLAQLVKAMYGVKVQLKTGLELGDYFPQITEEQTSAYSMEVVTVARNNNAEGLRQIYRTKGRDALNCFNRFGEGLLNLCCRRGFGECVEVLLSDEVHLSVRVRDDYGRTPLHDACWNPAPLTDICRKIMEQDPSLFFITDKRGFTAFQYARSNDWPVWRQFLLDNRHLLAPLASPETQERFS